LYWFFDDEPRAVADARRYLEKLSEQNPGRSLLTGLLIDLHEHRGDFESAARLQSLHPLPTSREDYFQARAASLVEYPYGPFGSELNAAILTLRSNTTGEPQLLWDLDESGATMFPLLLARHPAFIRLRALPQASDFLPNDAMAGRWS